MRLILFQGNVKKSFSLTFSSKIMRSKSRSMKYLRSFSDSYESIRVPTEFPRKCRPPIEHIVNFKANEYRTIAIAGFVLFGRIFSGSNDSHVSQLRYFWLLQVGLTISLIFHYNHCEDLKHCFKW